MIETTVPIGISAFWSGILTSGLEFAEVSAVDFLGSQGVVEAAKTSLSCLCVDREFLRSTSHEAMLTGQ